MHSPPFWFPVLPLGTAEEKSHSWLGGLIPQEAPPMERDT